MRLYKVRYTRDGMRLYKVRYTEEAGMSSGFEYFSSRVKAEQSAREWRAVESSGGLGYVDGDPDAELPADNDADVEAITVEPSKRGILDALNIHASHADNG